MYAISEVEIFRFIHGMDISQRSATSQKNYL